MKTFWSKLFIACSLLLLVGTSQPVVAQAPSAMSIYSVWVRLSLRGFAQNEIEAMLRNMDDKTIEAVKQRLRRTVLAQLQLKKIGEQVRISRDKDDLRNIISSIETEIRFAGMQDDDQLKLQIKDRYGIRLDRF